MSDYFNEKSKSWDSNELINRLSSAVGAAILSHVSLNEEMVVMDFGAGTGLISSHVAPRVKRVVAVDVSESMLSKLLAKPELQDKVVAVCQDILNEPVAEKFDLIMSAMAMHHVRDTNKLIQTFAAHLKPGAILALADLDKEDGSFHPTDTQGVFHSGFERDELKNIMERNGFENMRFTTAHTVEKDDRLYPVFLLTAKKSH